MSQNKRFNWVKTIVLSILVSVLCACVEIKSDAKVSSDAKVGFTTTYDISKIISVIQSNNKDSSDDMVKMFSCEKMDEKLTKEYSCKDLGAGKLAVSGEFNGNESNGVVLTENGQVSVDAVQLFKKVADLNSNADSGANSDNPASQMMKNGLVPVAVDQAAQYKQVGMTLTLNVQMPSEILTLDGVQANKGIKDNTVSVNFIDIAGKDSYIIMSKSSTSGIWKKILWVLLAILLLIVVTLYLMKWKKKPQTPTPTAPYSASEANTEAKHHTKPTTEVSSPIDEKSAQVNHGLKDDNQPDSENHHLDGKV